MRWKSEKPSFKRRSTRHLRQKPKSKPRYAGQPIGWLAVPRKKATPRTPPTCLQNSGLEAAERHGLGKLYAERVDALREVMELLFGLGAEFRGYQDGPPHVVDVVLPSAGALGSPPDILSRNAQCGVWRRLADALRRDPRCDASKILPRLA